MKPIRNTLLSSLLLPLLLLLTGQKSHGHYDSAPQRWLNRDPAGEDSGMNLYRFAECNPINRFDPFGLNACDNLLRDIGRFAGVGEKLNDMFLNWRSGQTWRDYGLAPAANAAGFRSPNFRKLSPYTQDAINQIEGNGPINYMQAAQLVVIGGGGYYTLGLHGLVHGTSAREQWWLTHIAVERFRNRWLLRELEDRYRDCAPRDQFNTHLMP